MAFPTSPTNGQQANINGITYTYSSAATAWTVSTSVSNTFVSINVSNNVNSGNVLATGVISATGNITGGNVLGGANVNATTHTGTTVSVSANVTGGNLLTGGLISAAGNISANNATFTSNQTLSYGTANGVIYLNSNKVATSGTVLQFDGTNLGLGTTSPSTGKFSDASYAFLIQSASTSTGTNIFASNSDNSKFVGVWSGHSSANSAVGVKSGTALTFGAWSAITGVGGFTEWAQFDSSGNLGVGTTSPSSILHISKGATSGAQLNITRSSATATVGVDNGNSIIVGAAAGDLSIRSSNANILFADSSGTEGMRLASGNLGVGTTSPSQRLHLNIGSATAIYSRIQNSAGDCYLGLDTSGNTNLSADNTGNQLIFKTQATERARFDSSGNFSITQTPGKYTVDVTGGATSIANGATVDFPSSSGMLVVNNWYTGAVTIYLCGGGAVTVVSTVIASAGTFAYNSGIGGYTWTNNIYGGTATFGFFFVRTRTTA